MQQIPNVGDSVRIAGHLPWHEHDITYTVAAWRDCNPEMPSTGPQVQLKYDPNWISIDHLVRAAPTTQATPRPYRL